MNTKKFATAALVAIALAITGCSTDSETPEPTPTETVTHTPEPEVKAPEACREYIKLSEEAFGHSADIISVLGDAVTHMLVKVENSVPMNDADLILITDYMEDITSSNEGLEEIQKDLHRAKSECLSN